MPDNGARSLHEFIVGNLFGMALHSRAGTGVFNILRVVVTDEKRRNYFDRGTG